MLPEHPVPTGWTDEGIQHHTEDSAERKSRDLVEGV